MRRELNGADGMTKFVVYVAGSFYFFFSSRRRHTRFDCDWSSDVCSSDLEIRSYVTVAIGCTGGRHRSVYLAERLAGVFRAQWRVLVRHRGLAREGAQADRKSVV